MQSPNVDWPGPTSVTTDRQRSPRIGVGRIYPSAAHSSFCRPCRPQRFVNQTVRLTLKETKVWSASVAAPELGWVRNFGVRACCHKVACLDGHRLSQLADGPALVPLQSGPHATDMMGDSQDINRGPCGARSPCHDDDACGVVVSVPPASPMLCSFRNTLPKGKQR